MKTKKTIVIFLIAILLVSLVGCNAYSNLSPEQKAASDAVKKELKNRPDDINPDSIVIDTTLPQEEQDLLLEKKQYWQVVELIGDILYKDYPEYDGDSTPDYPSTKLNKINGIYRTDYYNLGTHNYNPDTQLIIEIDYYWVFDGMYRHYLSYFYIKDEHAEIESLGDLIEYLSDNKKFVRDDYGQPKRVGLYFEQYDSVFTKLLRKEDEYFATMHELTDTRIVRAHFLYPGNPSGTVFAIISGTKDGETKMYYVEFGLFCEVKDQKELLEHIESTENPDVSFSSHEMYAIFTDFDWAELSQKYAQ